MTPTTLTSKHKVKEEDMDDVHNHLSTTDKKDDKSGGRNGRGVFDVFIPQNNLTQEQIYFIPDVRKRKKISRFTFIRANWLLALIMKE